jgi:hypothetical protein
MRLALLASLVLPLSLAACSSSSPTGSGGGGSASTSSASTGGAGGTGGASAETCTATFRWLQKDAYKDTAGRTSALWPPHTTTALEVVCTQAGSAGPGEVVASAFQANHGTLPTDVDAEGKVILVETKHAEVVADRATLTELVTAYTSCACDPTTKFLSLDSLKDAAVEALVQNVIAYLQSHLVCSSAGGVDALVQALAEGKMDQVLMDLPTCTWDSGSDLASGLDEALSTFLATTKEVLGEYHVCNNDAALQAGLFTAFAEDHVVTACDGGSPLCHGPKWFYEP